jgi:hypothetical protein
MHVTVSIMDNAYGISTSMGGVQPPAPPTSVAAESAGVVVWLAALAMMAARSAFLAAFLAALASARRAWRAAMSFLILEKTLKDAQETPQPFFCKERAGKTGSNGGEFRFHANGLQEYAAG